MGVDASSKENNLIYFFRLNESCLTQICHVTCQWVISQGSEAYQIWMSRVDSDGLEKNTVVRFFKRDSVMWHVKMFEGERFNFIDLRSHVSHKSIASCQWIISQRKKPWLFGGEHSCEVLQTWICNVTHEGVMSHGNASYHIWMHHVDAGGS